MATNFDFALFDDSLSSEHAMTISRLVGEQSAWKVQELLLMHAARLDSRAGAAGGAAGSKRDGLRELGQFYLDAGKHRKAIACFTPLHEAGDRRATAALGKAYYWWAYGHEQYERREKAIDYLTEAMDLPGVPAILAYAYWEEFRTEEAEHVVREWAARDCETALAGVNSKVFSRVEGIALLEGHRAIGNFQVLGTLGQLYLKEGRDAEARAALADAVGFDEWSAQYYLGKVLLRLGEEREAIAVWRKAGKDGDDRSQRKARKVAKARREARQAARSDARRKSEAIKAAGSAGSAGSGGGCDGSAGSAGVTGRAQKKGKSKKAQSE
ncbi:tetratricopeptide repeat protein [Timonella senegalensis]|uniref:tetratricopeptide repeat protein n=1 Tax=Timonella senegalensis TaxID=1465825 RepID=UPI0028A7A40F|nr:hypothetical protein [Timonella senegalensis]